MHKKLVFFAFLLIAGLLANAQSFSHSFGYTYLQSYSAGGSGITYSPRYNFIQLGDEATLSAGTHTTVTFSFSSRNGGNFGLDIPAVLELNLGHASSEDSDAGFGGFIGAGLGYSVLMGGLGYNKAFGPIVNGGIRFEINGNSTMIRISYLTNMVRGQESVIGVGLGYNLN